MDTQARGRYGPIVDDLLDQAPAMPLDGGEPAAAAGERLAGLSPVALFAEPVADAEMAAACLSALWLRHGFLDQSHRLSQGIASAEGSFWHGIMHRREGDYPNAKYWFRRVGPHPVLAALAERSAGAFDAFAFVDACRAAVTAGRTRDPAACAFQQAEWDLLFDHCWRGALGR